MLVEQLRHHQDEARRAVAALKRARLDKGLLHGIEHGRRIETLDGGDLGAVDERREIETARNRAAVDNDGTAAAQALAAALARAGEPELGLQHLDQVVMR